MTEPEWQCTFVILIDNSFDRSFAQGYSFHGSEAHVQTLRPHNRCEAAKALDPVISAYAASWEPSLRFFVGDTGTCGGPPRT